MEPDIIQANASEAARFYQRGVAAAKAGQKRIAAGLLTRSVKLDPRNESAWLWLSGVLEDPHQIAFCLNSVLKLNPNNERAHRGLRWLEERKLLQGQPARTPLMDVQVDVSASRAEVVDSNDSWWVSWRQWRRDVRLVNLMWWAIPLLILSLALAIHQSFAMALERSNQPPALPTVVAEVDDVPAPNLLVPTMTARERATAVPVLNTTPNSVRESESIGYMRELTPLRQDLREAVEAYRQSTNQPGSSLGHVAAAQEFRNSVQHAYDTMLVMTPPDDLRQAHEEYLKGLELELAAINDLLEFYSTYRVELANRAALRFQEASNHFDQARLLFGERLEQIEHSNIVSPHTLR
jgi:tetratricopeptide (TPR) repeat protein